MQRTGGDAQGQRTGQGQFDRLIGGGQEGGGTGVTGDADQVHAAGVGDHGLGLGAPDALAGVVGLEGRPALEGRAAGLRVGVGQGAPDRAGLGEGGGPGGAAGAGGLVVGGGGFEVTGAGGAMAVPNGPIRRGKGGHEVLEGGGAVGHQGRGQQLRQGPLRGRQQQAQVEGGAGLVVRQQGADQAGGPLRGRVEEPEGGVQPHPLGGWALPVNGLQAAATGVAQRGGVRQECAQELLGQERLASGQQGVGQCRGVLGAAGGGQGLGPGDRVIAAGRDRAGRRRGKGDDAGQEVPVAGRQEIGQGLQVARQVVGRARRGLLQGQGAGRGGEAGVGGWPGPFDGGQEGGVVEGEGPGGADLERHLHRHIGGGQAQAAGARGEGQLDAAGAVRGGRDALPRQSLCHGGGGGVAREVDGGRVRGQGERRTLVHPQLDPAVAEVQAQGARDGLFRERVLQGRARLQAVEPGAVRGGLGEPGGIEDQTRGLPRQQRTAGLGQIPECGAGRTGREEVAPEGDTARGLVRVAGQLGQAGVVLGQGAQQAQGGEAAVALPAPQALGHGGGGLGVVLGRGGEQAGVEAPRVRRERRQPVEGKRCRGVEAGEQVVRVLQGQEAGEQGGVGAQAQAVAAFGHGQEGAAGAAGDQRLPVHGDQAAQVGGAIEGHAGRRCIVQGEVDPVAPARAVQAGLQLQADRAVDGGLGGLARLQSVETLAAGGVAQGHGGGVQGHDPAMGGHGRQGLRAVGEQGQFQGALRLRRAGEADHGGAAQRDSGAGRARVGAGLGGGEEEQVAVGGELDHEAIRAGRTLAAEQAQGRGRGEPDQGALARFQAQPGKPLGAVLRTRPAEPTGVVGQRLPMAVQRLGLGQAQGQGVGGRVQLSGGEEQEGEKVLHYGGPQI